MPRRWRCRGRGKKAKGATLYTTLEPCAHASERGPTCAALIPEAGIARVVIGIKDPDPRTAGQGIDDAARRPAIEVKAGRRRRRRRATACRAI